MIKEIGKATAKLIPNALNQIIKKCGSPPTFINVRTKDIIRDIIIDTTKQNHNP